VIGIRSQELQDAGLPDVVRSTLPISNASATVGSSGRGDHMHRLSGEKEMRRFIIALSALGLIAGSTPGLASPCRDAKGKFVKCPHKPTRCKDAKGKFAKCGTPGAKPA
jgi:hypothetical protein